MKNLRFYLLLSLAFTCTACEEEFIPDVPDTPPSLVVEGYIEGGERPSPPFVILTRSVPFFQEIDAEQFSQIFVRDAVIRVREGDREVTLQEVCLSELTPEQIALAQQLFGLDLSGVGFNFCVYVDLSFQMLGEVGKTYELEVEADGQQLRATTTIPPLVRLDSLAFFPTPGEPSDTLRELRIFFQEPGDETNFYRYQTQINSEPLRSPFNSVVDDRLINGKPVEVPLPKAEEPNTDFDPSTFGFYRLGDTVLVKWTTIDQAHFDFWNTLEFNRANQGPFSNYTVIDNNIEGGLGIWGGIGATYYPDLLVQDD